MIKDKVFITIEIPNVGMCTILEGKGVHYFSALSKSEGDTSLLIKYLMLDLVLISDTKVTENQLDNMHISEVSYISEILGTMMSRIP